MRPPGAQAAAGRRLRGPGDGDLRPAGRARRPGRGARAAAQGDRPRRVRSWRLDAQAGQPELRRQGSAGRGGEGSGPGEELEARKAKLQENLESDCPGGTMSEQKPRKRCESERDGRPPWRGRHGRHDLHAAPAGQRRWTWRMGMELEQGGSSRQGPTTGVAESAPTTAASSSGKQDARPRAEEGGPGEEGGRGRRRPAREGPRPRRQSCEGRKKAAEKARQEGRGARKGEARRRRRQGRGRRREEGAVAPSKARAARQEARREGPAKSRPLSIRPRSPTLEAWTSSTG